MGRELNSGWQLYEGVIRGGSRQIKLKFLKANWEHGVLVFVSRVAHPSVGLCHLNGGPESGWPATDELFFYLLYFQVSLFYVFIIWLICSVTRLCNLHKLARRSHGSLVKLLSLPGGLSRFHRFSATDLMACSLVQRIQIEIMN